MARELLFSLLCAFLLSLRSKHCTVGVPQIHSAAIMEDQSRMLRVHSAGKGAKPEPDPCDVAIVYCSQQSDKVACLQTYCGSL